MKNLIRVFILTVCAATSFAQSVDVMGGFNAATITGEPGHSMRLGYYVGVGKDISISKQLSFRPEVYYSKEGAESDGTRRLTFHYVQMPLFFNYTFGKVGIAFGPQVGMLIGANYKTERGDRLPILPVMNKFDVAVGGGPYYKITEQLKVEVRAVFSITQFNTEEEETLRNRVIQAGVSWTITNPGSK
ncbi:MAG TPA: porin family protein [Cyclobacteriaceae bacterium]|nr:porin family protein [Cyclobacteriaceae bacterium]